MNNIYEATITSVKKIDKVGKDGESRKLIEIKYKSNGKEFSTTILPTNTDLIGKLKKDTLGSLPTDRALSFIKNGKFNQLVDILPKGSAPKKAFKSYGKQDNSQGMEKGNALHCASRLVGAVLYRSNLDLSDLKDKISDLASLVNNLANAIVKESHNSLKETKEEKELEDFEEVDDIDDVINSTSNVDEDFNDDINF